MAEVVIAYGWTDPKTGKSYGPDEVAEVTPAQARHLTATGIGRLREEPAATAEAAPDVAAAPVEAAAAVPATAEPAAAQAKPPARASAARKNETATKEATK